MKSNTHPTWHNQAKVTCSCGNVFTTGSTLPELSVDICAACHPFYTGEMKFVDVQGRVEKFQAKLKQAESYKKQNEQKKVKKVKRQQDASRSLKDVLTDLKQEVKASSQKQ
jgi:large subunit ribosomal protein L31